MSRTQPTPVEAPPLKIFIIYAHEDKPFKDELLKSLKLLQKNGLVEAWHDRDLVAGDDWDKVIRGHLERAQLILPVISIDFFNSDYIEQVEIEEAFRRYERQEAHILPIIARPCKWMDDPRISKLQALPENGVPIAKWSSRDEAFESVYDGIKGKIVEIHEGWKAVEAEKKLREADTAAYAGAKTIGQLEDYLKKYTLHAPEARLKMNALKDKEAKAAEKERAAVAAKAALAAKEASEKNLPEMVLIKGGSFQMGDVFDDSVNKDENPVHNVTLGDFYLGKYAVTVAQFKAFIEDSGYKTDADKEGNSRGWDGKAWTDLNGVNWKCDISGQVRPESEYNHPVIHVSWNDAKACAEWFSKRTGLKFRLPTEAEWEYAAREGGKKVRFGNGKDIADPKEINFCGLKDYKQPYSLIGEYRRKTAPVGSLNCPNALGLHDMSGNVWEWCEDWYHDSYKGAPADGSAWLSPTGSNRVVRGGSWGSVPLDVRVAYRGNNGPALRSYNFGFRLARTK